MGLIHIGDFRKNPTLSFSALEIFIDLLIFIEFLEFLTILAEVFFDI